MTTDQQPRILVIDDEPSICGNCVKILTPLPAVVETALNGYDALRLMEEKPFDVVITDLKMSRLGGMEVLGRIKERYADTAVIVMTGYANVSSAVEVMKMGAYDYLPKPFTPQELRAVVNQALDQRRLKLQNRELMEQKESRRAVSHQLIGGSDKVKKIVGMVAKVAPTDATVLLIGESGTGKELIARAVHANSNRHDKIFFAVDCGTLKDNFLESELFGHVKGAFTGAHKEKTGIFQLAHQGTVFLDEISNISLEVQGKLLRFLETREFLPLGGTAIRKVDIRLIFATNKNLEEMVAAGQFREDFYYRIFVYPIHIPPLRERKSDILPIAYYFLKQYSRNMGKTIDGFDDAAVSRMTEYNWPGNVRQLKNTIERAVILCEKERITLKELPLLRESGEFEEMIEHVPVNCEELKRLKKQIRDLAVQKVEKNFLFNALARNDWNISRAARETGMQRTNFQSLMKKRGITRPDSSK
ncbi:MAG: sigma-54 dependent transcriptional regulator [Thermodesulfobacteriota bacterium]